MLYFYALILKSFGDNRFSHRLYALPKLVHCLILQLGQFGYSLGSSLNYSLYSFGRLGREKPVGSQSHKPNY